MTRLLSESDPVVTGEIKVSGEEKVGLNTSCFSKPWFFTAWEIIAVTQFSNVKARQHYFNRLSHLFALLFFFPLHFHLCLFPLQIYEVIIPYFPWSMANMLYIRHSWTFCECNWSINVTDQNIIMPMDVWRVWRFKKYICILVPCHFNLRDLELQKQRTQPSECQEEFGVWQCYRQALLFSFLLIWQQPDGWFPFCSLLPFSAPFLPAPAPQGKAP